MFFTWLHWEFLYSKAISQRCIDIRVILKLSEESAWIIAEEYVGTGLDGQIVADLVIYVRPHVNVLIGGGKISE